ncbi:hypothetical protein EW146_g4415 [Bondarzewia mesenterica]|uniref:Uncharacterized protein n=1 Tax=Bondarzewia mesenterica TaxID=1095465 RepID=A0A4S4LVR6_9AGAM|nr:hypothetical protein EW146_g4415 [Bondarzewia mesenterica]
MCFCDAHGSTPTPSNPLHISFMMPPYYPQMASTASQLLLKASTAPNTANHLPTAQQLPPSNALFIYSIVPTHDAQIDTKSGSEVGIADISRRGFTAIAHAAMFTTTSISLWHAAQLQGMDGRRANALRWLDIGYTTDLVRKSRSLSIVIWCRPHIIYLDELTNYLDRSMLIIIHKCDFSELICKEVEGQGSGLHIDKKDGQEKDQYDAMAEAGISSSIIDLNNWYQHLKDPTDLLPAYNGDVKAYSGLISSSTSSSTTSSPTSLITPSFLHLLYILMHPPSNDLTAS